MHATEKVHKQHWILPSLLSQEFLKLMKVALFRLVWPQISLRFLFSSRYGKNLVISLKAKL